MSPRTLSRRRLLPLLALGAGGALLGRGPGARGAEAARVDVKDPAARSLGYVENAAQVDKKKFPSFVAGSSCDNCLLLQGKAGSAYRPCTAFQGRLVAVAGWCSAWTAEI